MDAYFDSAIIVKLYVQEATSSDAVRIVSNYAPPYALTQWQTLEVKNAIRLKAFRGEITLAEMNQSIAAFDQDIAAARWQRAAYDVAHVEQKTEELSAAHCAQLGCRTLDIIHVAAATLIGCKDLSRLIHGRVFSQNNSASRSNRSASYDTFIRRVRGSVGHRWA